MSVRTTPLRIALDDDHDLAREFALDGLAVPQACRGVILFAHESGSGRHSPRNRAVADRRRRG